MQQLFFWQVWPQPQRRLFVSLLVLLVAVMGYYLYGYYVGTPSAIPLELETATATMRVPLDSFPRSLFVQVVETDSYYVTQRFAAGALQVNPLAARVYLVLLLSGVVLLVSAISDFTRLWYYVGVTAIIAFFAYLRLDILGIFGMDNQIPLAVVLALFGGLSYYFHAFAPQTNLYKRVVAFALLAVLLSVVVLYGATVPNPELYLANYGLAVPLVLALLFVALVAFDIPAVFYVLMTDSKAQGKTNNMLNFSVMMVLYLGNLLLLHLRNRMVWSMDMVYFNMFWLLIVSAIVGLWHFQKKEVLYKSIMRFAPTGAVFFVGLAVVAFATISYAFTSANDPLVEVFEDAVLYSHLSFGTAFFIYVFVNYSDIMNRAAKAHRVMYEPRYMPVLGVQLLGLTGVFVFVVAASRFQYFQTKAAYYNGLGDTYYAFGDMPLAQKFYEEALSNEYQNHHSNYAIASIYQKQEDPIRAAAYYKQALRKKPTEQTFVGLSNYYLNTKQTLEAMFTLREGLQEFPESGVLYNNLALAYMETKFADSALYCFRQAEEHGFADARFKPIPQTNLLGFLARRDLAKTLDTIPYLPEYFNYTPYQTNRLALLNLAQKPDEKAFDVKTHLPDTTLDAVTFGYLFNVAINAVQRADTAAAPLLQSLRVKNVNADYASKLKFAQAINYYYAGQHTKGYDLLAQLDLAYNDASTSYTEMHAQWLSQQQAWPLVVKAYFRLLNSTDANSVINYAMALAENGELEQSLDYWQKIAAADTSNEVAKIMSNILTKTSETDLAGMAESSRLLALHYRKVQMSEQLQAKVLASFQDKKYKVLAACELADLYFAQNKPEALADVLRTAEMNVSATDEPTRNEYHFRDLKYRQTAQPDGNILRNAIANEPLNLWHVQWKPYFEAMAAYKLKQPQAKTLFAKALEAAPFDEQVILDACAALNADGNKQAAYDALVNALNTNPRADKVRQEYVLQCFRLNMDILTDDEIAKLKNYLKPAEFEAFMKKVAVFTTP